MNENQLNCTFFCKDFILSGIVGSIVNTLMAPFFNLKLAQNNKNITPNCSEQITHPKEGFLTHSFKFIREEGVKNLWRGNASASISAFWFQGISFSIKNALRNILQNNTIHKSFLNNLSINTFSGMVGGIIALTALFPFNYPRVMLVQMKGLKDFYKDFRFYLIPVAIYRGLYFGIFDSIKTNSKNKRTEEFNLLLCYSFLSTISAQVIAAPFEEVKIKVLRSKEVKSLNLYFDFVRKECSTALMECLKFKFPFLYRTVTGALILAFYEKLSLSFLS